MLIIRAFLACHATATCAHGRLRRATPPVQAPHHESHNSSNGVVAYDRNGFPVPVAGGPLSGSPVALGASIAANVVASSAGQKTSGPGSASVDTDLTEDRWFGDADSTSNSSLSSSTVGPSSRLDTVGANRPVSRLSASINHSLGTYPDINVGNNINQVGVSSASAVGPPTAQLVAEQQPAVGRFETGAPQPGARDGGNGVRLPGAYGNGEVYKRKHLKFRKENSSAKKIHHTDTSNNNNSSRSPSISSSSAFRDPISGVVRSGSASASHATSSGHHNFAQRKHHNFAEKSFLLPKDHHKRRGGAQNKKATAGNSLKNGNNNVEETDGGSMSAHVEKNRPQKIGRTQRASIRLLPDVDISSPTIVAQTPIQQTVSTVPNKSTSPKKASSKHGGPKIHVGHPQKQHHKNNGGPQFEHLNTSTSRLGTNQPLPTGLPQSGGFSSPGAAVPLSVPGANYGLNGFVNGGGPANTNNYYSTGGAAAGYYQAPPPIHASPHHHDAHHHVIAEQEQAEFAEFDDPALHWEDLDRNDGEKLPIDPVLRHQVVHGPLTDPLGPDSLQRPVPGHDLGPVTLATQAHPWGWRPHPQPPLLPFGAGPVPEFPPEHGLDPLLVPPGASRIGGDGLVTEPIFNTQLTQRDRQLMKSPLATMRGDYFAWGPKDTSLERRITEPAASMSASSRLQKSTLGGGGHSHSANNIGAQQQQQLEAGNFSHQGSVSGKEPPPQHIDYPPNRKSSF